MARYSKTNNKLYCFSPEVVLFTFIIESILAAYAWWRYKSTHLGRLATLFLVFLAIFQFTELMVCKGGDPSLWPRIGFIATAFLPILGIDMVAAITKHKINTLSGYAFAVAFSLCFALLPEVFTGAQCTNTFVVFSSNYSWLDTSYSIYYATTLALGLYIMIRGIKQYPKQKAALYWALVGYLAFIVPALSLSMFVIFWRQGFASILCGFAVFLAIILTTRVLPLAHRSMKN